MKQTHREMGRGDRKTDRDGEIERGIKRQAEAQRKAVSPSERPPQRPRNTLKDHSGTGSRRWEPLSCCQSPQA